METIKIFMDESGLTTDLQMDTPIFQGHFHNKLFNIFVPTSIIDNATAVKIGAIKTSDSGKRIQTREFYLNYVKTLIIDGKEYALYERLLPKAFTTDVGTLQLVINVVSTKNGKIQTVVSSQVNNFTINVSTYVNDIEVIDTTNAEQLSGKINQNTAILETKQDKIDENLQTEDKTVVGAINENTSQIATNANDIEILKQQCSLPATNTTLGKIKGSVNNNLSVDIQNGTINDILVGGKNLKTHIEELSAKECFSGDYNDLTNKPTIPKYGNDIKLAEDNSGGLTDAIINTNIKIDRVADRFAEKQDKTDQTLSTTDKTVVGAINELNSSVGSLETEVMGITDQIYDTMSTNVVLSAIASKTSDVVQLTIQNHTSYDSFKTNNREFIINAVCNISTTVTDVVKIVWGGTQYDVYDTQGNALKIGSLLTRFVGSNRTFYFKVIYHQTSDITAFSIVPITMTANHLAKMINGASVQNEKVVIQGSSGGGSSGGTTNYQDLDNKPILNTSNTTSQTPNASETINGTINLHKVSKTGALADAIQDSTHRTVTDAEKTDWNNTNFSRLTNVPQASTGVAGVIQIATDSEAETGTNTTKAVNPKQLMTAIQGLGSVFTLKGSKATASQLPSTGNTIGDVWYVVDESVGYIWLNDGTADKWEQLGLPIDLSGYVQFADIINALNSTASDKPLSALQGKVLNDMISTLTQELADYSNPNLLINGDFKVNQRGQSSYSGAGYTVDGWEARNSGFSTTITSNGITITTTSNGWFAQKLNYNYSKLAGKTITISCKINGVIFSKSSILPLLEPSSQIDLIRTNNFGSLRSVFRLTYLNGALWSNFYNYANETFTIEYAKLEIGSIATPFSPKPYEEELAACQCIYGGIATTYSNPNLLINGDFRVNQRGESALTVRSGITQYTFDRWRVGTSGGVTSTLVKSEKGMSITNTGTVSLSQYFEDEFLQNKGKMATLSAKINGVVYSYTAEIGTSTDKLMSNNVRFIIATGIYNSVQEKFIRFTMYDANVTYNFEWVKLEIGSVATAFSPRPYAEELAMCQRYYQKFVTSSNYGTFSYCYTANNTNQVRFELDLPVKMRDSSTIKLNGNMQVVGSLGNFAVVGLENTLSLGNRKILIATIAGTLTSWSNYFIQAHNDRSANIELDAEIY